MSALIDDPVLESLPVGYISLDELVSATTIPGESLCRACFDGQYPIDLPTPELLGKHMLEGISRAVEPDAPADGTEPYDQLLPGVGASDALSRP